MSIRLWDTAPDFTSESTEGTIQFHKWLGDSWGILFSHPADYTPVCTTELGGLEKAAPEFYKRNVKLIALSCDEVEAHLGWIKDIKSYGGLDSFSYPIIADPGINIQIRY